MKKKRAKPKKPCGLCGGCDFARFRDWRRRIEVGLNGEAHNELSERFALIQEIHHDVARRHPLGIAVRLNEVIAALAMDDNGDAAGGLADLEHDESESFRLNGRSVTCAESLKAFTT